MTTGIAHQTRSVVPDIRLALISALQAANLEHQSLYPLLSQQQVLPVQLGLMARQRRVRKQEVHLKVHRQLGRRRWVRASW